MFIYKFYNCNTGSRFYFITHHGVNPESIFVFNDYLHRHSQVGILQKVDTLDSKKIMYKIYGYNFFHKVNGLGNVLLNHLWTPESKITNSKQAFTDIMDMQGKSFNLRYRNLQNIRIRILQIFCYDFFARSKVGANCSGITQPFPNPNLIFFSNVPQILCCRIIKKNQKKIWRIRIFWMFWCCEQVNYFFSFWNVL